MNQSNRVLVTGAGGFIGRATVSDLKAAGFSVTLGVRSGYESERTDLIAIDLAKPDAILELVDKVRFDAIVHLGAQIGWSGATEAEMYVPNVLSTGCLAALAAHWSAYFVFASAAIVCGIKTEIIEENSTVLADSPYARSKWLGEQLLAASHVSHCNLRIGGVFGAQSPSHLGLNRAIAGAVSGVAPTQIGTGIAQRNYVYVQDVARAITFALRERLQGTHLLAGSESLTISQMMESICNTFLPGQHPEVKEGPEASNQVIMPSPALPETRSFLEALVEIRGFST